MATFNRQHIIYGIYCWMIASFLQACAPQQHSADDSEAASANQVPMVEVVHPQKRIFNSQLSITGTLMAHQEVKLYAMESGFLRDIYKDIGDAVKRGEVIARLENPELSEELKMAEAYLKQQQALHDAKEKRYQRIQSIYEQTPDLTTVEDLEAAEAQALSSKAAMDQAAAQLEALRKRSQFLKVRAPFNGIVTNRYVHPGALIQNGIQHPQATPVVDIQDIENLRLVAAFPESDVRYLSLKETVSIEFPELPGKSLRAPISRMAQALNPETKTMRTEIDIPNPKLELKPGMYARIQAPLSSQTETLAVPTMAITAIKNQTFVYKVAENNVILTPVKLGLEDKYFIEILSAELTEADLVIVKGKGLISDGMKVKTKMSKPSP